MGRVPDSTDSIMETDRSTNGNFIINESGAERRILN